MGRGQHYIRTKYLGIHQSKVFGYERWSLPWLYVPKGIYIIMIMKTLVHRQAPRLCSLVGNMNYINTSPGFRLSYRQETPHRVYSPRLKHFIVCQLLSIASLTDHGLRHEKRVLNSCIMSGAKAREPGKLYQRYTRCIQLTCFLSELEVMSDSHGEFSTGVDSATEHVRGHSHSGSNTQDYQNSSTPELSRALLVQPPIDHGFLLTYTAPRSGGP